MFTKTRTGSWMRFLTAGLFLAALPVIPAAGQDLEDGEEGAWYARVRHLEGDLQVTNPREEEAFTATVNTPLTGGDRFSSGPGGRAEIQLQGGSILRVDENSRFDFQSLGSPESTPTGVVVLRLWEGSLFIDHRQLTDPPVRFQIDTPSASVFLRTEGEFRIDVLDSGEVRVWSYAGEAEVVGDVRTVRVSDGQWTFIPDLADPLPPEPFNSARVDPFGEWVADRQEIYLAAAGTVEEPDLEELPQEMEPYVSEMSHHGSWQEVPEYGWVWRPHAISVSWRPYTHGYWRSYPSGWTWVSYEPWGWYPYHYGRWHWVVGLGWSWMPGRVYSGAWVSWAYSTSYIGWCPLNYYNRPAFVGLHLSTYDARGWTFVQYSRFHNRSMHRHTVAPAVVQSRERIHHGRNNPGFRASDLGSPDLGARLTREARRTNRSGDISNPKVRTRPFRTADPRETRGRSGDRTAPRIRTRTNPPRGSGRSEATPGGSGRSVSPPRGRAPDRERPQSQTHRQRPQRRDGKSTTVPGRGQPGAGETPRATPRKGRSNSVRMQEILDRVRRPQQSDRSGSQPRRTPTSTRSRSGSSKQGRAPSSTRSGSGSKKPKPKAGRSQGTRTRSKSTTPRQGNKSRPKGKSGSNRGGQKKSNPRRR
jgi:hypothetical protein